MNSLEEEDRRSRKCHAGVVKECLKDGLVVNLSDGKDPVQMAFRRIKAGTFLMGSRDGGSREQPVTEITFPQDFFMGAFPVTQEQYLAWRREEEGSVQSDGELAKKLFRFQGSLLLPAEKVNYEDACSFCNWLTGRLEPSEAKFAQVPTEAEWEYAARQSERTEYALGDGESALRAVGWFDENSKKRTHPVGLLNSNHAGLYDMNGNVWEWCQDVFRAKRYREIAPRAGDQAADGADGFGETGVQANRVMRGGSWGLPAWVCRSACRGWGDPRLAGGGRGFRVCLLPGPVGNSKKEAEPLKTVAECPSRSRGGGGTPPPTERIGNGAEHDEISLDTGFHEPK